MLVHRYMLISSPASAVCSVCVHSLLSCELMIQSAFNTTPNLVPRIIGRCIIACEAMVGVMWGAHMSTVDLLWCFDSASSAVVPLADPMTWTW